MKVLLLAMLSLFTFTTWASHYIAQIHSLDTGKGDEDHLVFLTDGHVAFVDSQEKALWSSLQENLRKQDWISVELDSKLNLVSAQTVEPQGEVSSSDEAVGFMSYEPTLVTSLANARTIFSNMKRGWQDESQCYNRAHVWTYEEFQRSGTKSNKLFLFFTSKYIREYRFYWWFHVTPMVYLNGSDQSEWRTLDRRYTGGPLKLKTWTDIFVKSHRSCPVVNKYSEYRNHQQSEDCYLIPTSMYFWQPRDIEARDRTGRVKTSFFQSEIDYAYWEAF